MAQTNINIRMDEDLKRQFEALCQNIGMSMTTAITIFAKKMVNENKVPFELTGNDPFAGMNYTPLTQEELDMVLNQRILEWEENREEYTEADTADAVFAALDKKYFG